MADRDCDERGLGVGLGARRRERAQERKGLEIDPDSRIPAFLKAWT